MMKKDNLVTEKTVLEIKYGHNSEIELRLPLSGDEKWIRYILISLPKDYDRGCSLWRLFLYEPDKEKWLYNSYYRGKEKLTFKLRGQVHETYIEAMSKALKYLGNETEHGI